MCIHPPSYNITASDQILLQLSQIGENGSYEQEGAMHRSGTGTGQLKYKSASHNFPESVSVRNSIAKFRYRTGQGAIYDTQVYALHLPASWQN